MLAKWGCRRLSDLRALLIVSTARTPPSLGESSCELMRGSVVKSRVVLVSMMVVLVGLEGL